MKAYEEPSIEVVTFVVEDIITTSIGGDTPLKPNQSPWG